jgi:alpha-tubulin suppressor-like RCC1 family protein/phosphodiesterase/alkaline phosphatase D-like protein
MRIPRLVLALLLVGTPVAAVVATTSVASADPFTYSSVEIGNSTVCAVTNDGQGLCWGSNRDQYLIASSRELNITTPTQVPLPNNDRFVTIAGGTNRTWCGLAVSGKVYCWGDHHIGSYFTPTSRTPVAVEFPHAMTITEVHSGYSNGCALNTDAELWCWGDILESGSGQTEPMRTPVKVAMPNNERVINFDNGGASCAVTDLGNIYCWGHSNGAGQLGIGYASYFAYAISVTPLKVLTPAGVQFASVSTGLEHSCALSTTGTGYCWGDNYEGLFGNDSYADSLLPTPMIVPNNEKLTVVSTGWYHTCVLTVSGKTWCFGRGAFGELGTGTTLGGKTYRTPLVPSGTQFKTISAGLGTTCAIDQLDKVWCWGGLNWGTNGNGKLEASLQPGIISPVGTPTVTLDSATAIDAEKATVRGTVNANGYATRMTVEYSTSPTFTSSTTVSVFTVLRDNNYTAVAIPTDLNELAPRTSYYARMTATNTFGSTVSNAISFTTLGTEPTVTGLNIADITGNEANMSVSVNPGRLSTASVLEYSTDNTFVANVTTVPLSSTRGPDTQSLTAALTSLRARTTYYTRVTSTNRLGSTVSSTESFATIGELPRASLSSTQSSLTSISSTATVDTGLLSGTVYLEASTNRNFENSSSSNVGTFFSGGPTRHSLTVSGLTNRTDYFIRAIATNELGSFTTAVQSVRTAGGIPVIGNIAILPSTSTAALSTSIDTTGLDTFVTAEVSTHQDLSDPTEYFLYSGTVSGDYSATLKNLVPRVTFYLRVTATNDSGTVQSTVKTFVAVTPIGVVINDDNESSQSPRVVLSFTTPARTAAIRISNYADFSHARVIPTAPEISWQLLEPSGARSVRTVWVQFISVEGTVAQYSDSIDVITDEPTPPTSTTSTTTTIPEATVARALSATQPVVVARSYAPVRSATVMPRQKQSSIKKIQTKIGKKISTRTVVATKSGKYVIVFPKGIKTMSVRFVNKSGSVSAWSRVSAP